jgi:hypothetical protein
MWTDGFFNFWCPVIKIKYRNGYNFYKSLTGTSFKELDAAFRKPPVTLKLESQL